MRITLERPQIIIEAEKSRSILSFKHKYESLIPEFILFFCFFVVSTVAYAIGTEVIAYALNIGDEYYSPISLIAQLIMTLLIILLAFLWQGRKPRTLGFVKKNAFRDYLIGLGAGFVMFSAAVGICVLTGALTLSKTSNVNYALLVVFCLGWLFQGMAEEVLCRGFFLVSLARKHNLVIAVLGNSLAFAALHLGNDGIGFLPMVNLTLFGICASIYFIKTGNIWLVSAMHSIWNLVQGNLYGILVSGGFVGPTFFSSTIDESKTIINGGAFGLEGGLAVTIVLVISILIGLYIPSCDKSK